MYPSSILGKDAAAATVAPGEIVFNARLSLALPLSL